MKPKCQHCGWRQAVRPRQLCCPCHRQPEVRAKYPSRSKFASRRARGDVRDPDPREIAALAAAIRESRTREEWNRLK